MGDRAEFEPRFLDQRGDADRLGRAVGSPDGAAPFFAAILGVVCFLKNIHWLRIHGRGPRVELPLKAVEKLNPHLGYRSLSRRSQDNFPCAGSLSVYNDWPVSHFDGRDDTEASDER